MASTERKEKDKALLKQELEKTIQKPVLPETLQALKNDGRTRCICADIQKCTDF